MGLKRLLSKVGKAAGTIATITPAGKFAAGAKLLSGIKRVGKAGIQAMAPMAAMAAAAALKPKRRRKKGITDKEMMELLKLQMFVGKRSIPYQMAVLKALTGKLK